MNSRTQLPRPLVAMVAALLVPCAPTCFAQQRQVAITIDDLPRGGDGGPFDIARTAGDDGQSCSRHSASRRSRSSGSLMPAATSR